MCITETSKRINMTFREWKNVRHLIFKTGLNYQCDGNGIWIQLPHVATQGERDLHLKRLKTIVNTFCD